MRGPPARTTCGLEAAESAAWAGPHGHAAASCWALGGSSRVRTVAQPGAWAASPGRPWHGACNMLRHSTVSSTSRLVPLFSSAAVAERATDARSEKKICTWCARGGRGKAPRAAATAATICYCYENYYEYASASTPTAVATTTTTTPSSPLAPSTAAPGTAAPRRRCRCLRKGQSGRRRRRPGSRPSGRRPAERTSRRAGRRQAGTR